MIISILLYLISCTVSCVCSVSLIRALEDMCYPYSEKIICIVGVVTSITSAALSIIGITMEMINWLGKM